MAVEGNRSTQSLMSESGILLLCEPCRRGNETAEGEFYCVTCTEYLCSACTRSHRKSKASKDHKIINKYVSSESESEVLCNPCETDDETVEALFFCIDCNDNLCETCAKSHRKSKPSAHHKVFEIHAVSKLKNEIAKFSLKVNLTKDSIEMKCNAVNKCFNKYTADVNEFCSEMKTIVDSLGEQSITEAEAVKSQDLALLLDASNTCENILTGLGKITDSIDDLRKTKLAQQLFTEAEKTRNKIKIYKTQLNTAVGAFRYTNYTFQSCKILSETLKTASKLGILVHQVEGDDDIELASESEEQITHIQPGYGKQSIERKKDNFRDDNSGIDVRRSSSIKSDTHENTGAKTENFVAGRSTTQLKAELDKQVLLKVRGDHEKCFITGCIEFDHCSVVFVDNNNSNVKLFNLETGTLTSHCSVRQNPWDITCVNPDQFVVSCKNKLVFLNKQLSVERQMKVDGTCQGITYGQHKFFVTFTKPRPALKIISHDGEVLKTFSKQLDANIELKKPEYVSLCSDGNRIYISDCGLNMVTCLTSDGVKLFVYKKDSLREPRGVTVDEYNNVYVAGGKSNNIQHISSDGTLITVLLQESNGFWMPQKIGIMQSNNKMCVTHFGYGSNTVSVYNLVSRMDP